MDREQIDMLRKITVVFTTALGMQAENMQREHKGESMAFNYDDFVWLADTIRENSHG
jgi:hypothetical protein